MTVRPDLVDNAKGESQCAWCAGDPLYEAYHHDEWGRPVADERRLFEKMCLEGFQAGLSWITILRKREAFREAFHGFDSVRVARMTDRDVTRLLSNAGIVRHRGKIEAVIGNAQRHLELIALDGPAALATLIWSFEPATEDGPGPRRLTDLPARTAASTALSRLLRRRGFRFVGPTTCYALMQSMGLVNDHLAGCAIRPAVADARRGFRRPGQS